MLKWTCINFRPEPTLFITPISYGSPGCVSIGFETCKLVAFAKRFIYFLGLCIIENAKVEHYVSYKLRQIWLYKQIIPDLDRCLVVQPNFVMWPYRTFNQFINLGSGRLADPKNAIARWPLLQTPLYSFQSCYSWCFLLRWCCDDRDWPKGKNRNDRGNGSSMMTG